MFGCKRILQELKDNNILGIFGKGRSGKTTILAGLVQENKKRQKKNLKRKENKKLFCFDRIYCTDETIKDTIPFKYEEFGTWEIKDNSLILIDEAGLLVNNRKWKTMTDGQKEDIALIGHYHSAIVWCSQRVDVDINLLDRSHVIYLVKKISRAFSAIKTIKYDIDVDNEKGDIVSWYHKPEGWRDMIVAIKEHAFKLLYRPQYYIYFNSYKRHKKKTGIDPEDRYNNIDIDLTENKTAG